jgi:HK97 family phage major capsid protein
MGRIDDAFDDAVISMVARDVPRDREGRVIPSWPQFPTPQIDPMPAGGDPIQPFDPELAKAQEYDGLLWDDGRTTSYFRDLVTIAEKNARTHALMRAQVEGRDYMPSLQSIVPTRAEYLSGGFEGAVGRSSEASMAVEKRVREVRARREREKRQGRAQEQRASNITMVSGGVGLVPVQGAPRYVAELFADAARTKMRLAPRLFQGQLPSSGNIVLVPRATTGAVTAIQTTENTAPTDTAMVIDTATSPVVTITGQQVVSRQLLDRGVNTDADIAASLGASFAQILEQQVVNGSGASGQLTGLLGVSGITADTYVDGTPTASKAYGQTQKLLADVATAFGSGTDTLTLAMHPRRAAWLRDNAVVTQAMNYGAAGIIETTGIPTTLGAGTEDAIIALNLESTPAFIGPIRFQVDPAAPSNTLQVRILAYAYVALVGARIPASIGKLTGTGLIAPVFV